MDLLHSIRKPIHQHLIEFNKEYIAQTKSDVELLNEITSYLNLTDGKQIRPAFTYFAALICGNISKQTTRVALAIELLHTSTLIHDDVVDGSALRRGRKTVNANWNNKLAVLTGDYMLSSMLRILSENEDIEILKIVSRVAAQMSEGEILQQQKSILLDYSEESYYEVIRKKTAVLIAACFEGGAVSAKATLKEIEILKEIGMLVGIAFQIKDDILDYSISAQTGKLFGNDIRERKFTLPLIGFMRNASFSENEKIITTFSQKNVAIDESFIDELIHKVNQSEGVAFAESEMKRYSKKAVEMLDHFPDSEIKEVLKENILFTTERSI